MAGALGRARRRTAGAGFAPAVGGGATAGAPAAGGTGSGLSAWPGGAGAAAVGGGAGWRASGFARSRARPTGLAAPPDRPQRLDDSGVGDWTGGGYRPRRGHGFDVGGQRRRREGRLTQPRLPARRDAVVMKTVLVCDRANGDRKRNAQHREQANLGRRRRRRQVAPIVVFDINVLGGRRGRRRTEIVERVDGLVFVDEFIRGRRRKIRESLRPKIGRRLELGREHREATARVRDVRAFRIGMQIGPIGSGRIGADSPAPIGSLSPNREDGPHPSRLIRIRISREELAIALERVSLDSRGIGVFSGKTGYRLTLRLREREGRSRRVGGALEDVKWTVKLGGAPRQQSPLRLRIDRHARLIERLDDIDAALPDRARERLAVDPVGAFLVAGQRARSRVEGDQFAAFGIDQSEPRRQGRALSCVRIGPRRVENDDARPSRRRRKSMTEIGDADRFDRHIGVAIDLSVDRHEVIVAVILNRAASEVDERLHIGAGRRRFLQKITKGRTQGLTVEVARADHVKSGRLQSLGDKTSVVGGRRERRVTIGPVPNDKSNSGVRSRLLSFRGQREKARGYNQNCSENRV